MNRKTLYVAGMFLLALVSWLLWVPTGATAETTTDVPGGPISADTTWTLAGSPYIVEDSITVTNDATLTIEPGVVVQINSFGDRLTIDTGSTLSAEGTAAAPIIFTATNQGPSNWDSLVIGPGATATLQHCEISYGGWPNGGADGALNVQSSDVTVSDCAIHDNGDEGIVISGEELTPSFTNVEVRDNSRDAIVQSTFNMQPTYHNLTLSGNGADVIVSGGGTVTMTPLILADLGVPYIVGDSVTVSDGASLQLEPGVEWQFNSFADRLEILSGGTLTAQGTVADPIIFTATNQGPSNWDSLVIGPGATATLQHCEISYGGWPNGGADGALNVQSSDVTVSDCVIRDGGDEGIVLSGEGLSPAFTNVEIRDNGQDAIEQSTFNMQPTYTALTAIGNGNDAIVLPGGALPQTAVTFVDPGLPYEVTSSVTIPADTELTLEPGVTWLFNSFADQLRVEAGGSLTMVGSENNPILVSGKAGAPRSWQNISFAPGSTASLQHCEVSNGGWWATANDTELDGNLFIQSSGVSVRDCHIHSSDRVGIRVDNAQPTIKDNIIAGNEIGLINKTPATQVDASLNYWGHESGPYHPDLNPDGQGNEVSDGVLFNPWYSSDAFEQNNLAVTAVSTPPDTVAGDEITVNYTVQNGDNTVTGSWIDSVYLSQDDAFDADDLLLGRVTHTDGVAANSSYDESLTTAIPGVFTGDYYVLVIADSRRTIPDPNFENNRRVSDDQFNISIPTLPLDGSDSGALPAGRNRYYRLDVSAGADVLVSAEFTGEWHGELYLRRGSVPTRSEYDLSADSFDKAVQQVLLKEPADGAWYVLLHGLPGAPANATYTIEADLLPFSILESSPDTAGNAGETTMTLTGAGFTPGTSVSLRQQGQPDIAGEVTFVNRNHLLVTFDLEGVSLGHYNLVAAGGGESDTVTDALEVVEGVGGQLTTELILPSTSRSNTPFQARVVFENIGDANVPATSMRIQAPSGGTVWSEFQSSDDAGDSLQFLTVPAEAVAGGVLPPGASGEFVFWGTIPTTGATNFTLLRQAVQQDSPFDWNALRQAIRPEGAGAEWDDAFDLAVANAGNTHGDYIHLLADAADAAHEQGVPLLGLSDLFDYLIERSRLELPAALQGQLWLKEDGSAQPLAGAPVYLQPADPTAGYHTESWYDGRFAFFGAPAGVYSLTVPGTISPSLQTVTLGEGGGQQVTIAVQSGAVVEGQVRTEQWWLLPEAIVSARDEAGHLLASARTERGEYRLTGLPSGVAINVSAGAEDYVSAPAVELVTDNHETVNFVLGAGGDLRGQVFDNNDQPVEGATVSAGQEGLVAAAKSATTDSSGFYQIDGLAPGDYTLVAAHPDHGPSPGTQIHIVENEIAIQNLNLTTGGALVVEVVSLATGAPLTGAQVIPAYRGFESTAPETGTDGRVTLSDLPVGALPLVVDAQNYATETITPTVVSGSTEHVTVSLWGGGTIDGVVHQTDGTPWPNVPVTIVGDDHIPETVLTDAGGQFALDHVPVDDYYAVVGAGPDSSVGRVEFSISRTNPSATPVLVADGVPVEGVISVADGTPVADARVDLVQNGRRLAATNSDANGVYRFLVTQPDQYTVVAWDDAHGLVTRTVDVQLPGPLTGQSMQFGGNSHRLTLVNGEGQSLSGQSLLLSLQGVAAGDVPYPVTTDADGEALIPHLADGDYSVQAEAAGYAQTQQAFSHSSNNQSTQLVVENEIVLSGQVSFGDGSPVTVPLLVLEHDSSDAQLVIIGESNGSFRSDNLAPGDWSIWVSGYGIKSVFLSQSMTEDTELPVTVDAGGSILSGAITADGRAVSLALLSILDQQGRLIKSSFGNPDGSYRLDGLPAGTFTLRVEAAGYALYETPVSFSGSDSVTENVALAPALAMGISAQAPDPQQPLTVRQTAIEELSSSVTSYISGLQPPTQMPAHQAPVPDISDDCFNNTAARNAWLDMHKARDNMNAAYSDWSNSYYNGVDSGFNDLGLLSTEMAVLSLKVSTMGATSGASGSAETMFDVTGALGGLLTDSVLAAQGQADIKSIVLNTGSIVSSKAGQLGLANDIYSFLKDNQQAGVNEAAWQHIYNTQEAFYQDAAADYFAARANFYAVTREDCPEEDPEEPEKPDEEEQEDEEEVERRDSRDPNDIVGPLGYGPENWVRSTTQFDYTILFENVPTATAPAQVVMITHVLDDDLDLATFELGSFGFGELMVPVPGGRFSYQTRLSDRLEEGYFVDFSAELNPATRTVTWMLEAIDPATGDLIADPDAGFLPPNVNEPEGEGFVRFSIALEPNLSTGIQIDAQARIVFDENEPIDTPVYRNTIDAEAPQSAVVALPESVSPSFTVSWSGADAGAGIVGYDVYVSRDGGAYEKWQHGTPATSATFQGVDGSTYRFYSVALDGTGQRETTPAEPDATTTVSGERKHFLPVING